jgi:hypothetical protein
MNTLISEIKEIKQLENFPSSKMNLENYVKVRTLRLKIHTLTILNPIAELLKNEIVKLKFLPHNWDSYNAESISINAINLATDLVELLELNNILINLCTPLRDGGVQLEKSFIENDVEIEIHPDRTITLLIFDKEANFIEESNYSIDQIHTLINKLKTLDR